MSSLKSQEGCGKWLTTRGITNPKKQISVTASPCNTGPAVTPIIQDKLCHNMKQSKMSDFFGSRKQCNSVTTSSEVPVVAFTVKRGPFTQWFQEKVDEVRRLRETETKKELELAKELALSPEPYDTYSSRKSQQDSPDEGDAASIHYNDTSSTSQLHATTTDTFPFTQWLQEELDEFNRREMKKEDGQSSEVELF